MEEKLVGWLVGLLVLATGGLTWFMKAKMQSYDEKHRDHYRDTAELKTVTAAVEQRLEDHEDIARERMTRIEAMFTELRTNFIDVLHALRNGRRP
jgi:hypothetical protein